MVADDVPEVRAAARSRQRARRLERRGRRLVESRTQKRAELIDA